MGYYIDGPICEKADHLVREHGAEEVDLPTARRAIEDGSRAVVCVKGNSMFDAAGYCFDAFEFDHFADPRDIRPTTWLLMDRAKAEELSGFARKKAVAAEGGAL